MILTKKKTIKMLKLINTKIIYDEKLDDKEKKLINSLIMLSIQDLGGEQYVDNSTGGKKEA